MRKLFSLLLAVMMLGASCLPCVAGIVVGGEYVVAGDSYDDIVFQFNCDTATDGATPEIGSGVIDQISGGFIINTADQIQGDGCLDSNNDGYNKFSLDISNNFDYENSRIGFWINPQETIASGGYIIFTEGNTNNGFFSRPYNDGGGRISLKYLGGTASGTDVIGESVGTWYYIEISFSETEAKMYFDGSLVQTATAGANSFTDTLIYFGAVDGTAFDFLIDEIRISNNKDRDLYAIRNTVIS
jgi:hypothetical protein